MKTSVPANISPHWLRGLHAVQLRNSLPHSFFVLGLVTLCHAMPRAKCENHYTNIIQRGSLTVCQTCLDAAKLPLCFQPLFCDQRFLAHHTSTSTSTPGRHARAKNCNRSRAAAGAFLYEACASHLFEHETCRPRVQKSGTQNALLQKAYGAKVFPVHYLPGSAQTAGYCLTY